METTAVTPSFDAVYRAHAADVARWASRLGGPRMDLEDTVQEVFTLVHENLGRFRGEAKITTWLFRITQNVVRRQRRRERWRAFWGRAAPEVPDSVAEGSPEDDLERRQARDLVRQALDRMSERRRTALVLFELEELPGEEVAERMGIETGNLWVLLHRAREDLVARLRELRAEAEPSLLPDEASR